MQGNGDVAKTIADKSTKNFEDNISAKNDDVSAENSTKLIGIKDVSAAISAKDNGVGENADNKGNAIGITQLAVDHIFNAINVEEKGKFLVTASYLQVKLKTAFENISRPSSVLLDSSFSRYVRLYEAFLWSRTFLFQHFFMFLVCVLH